MKYYCHNPSAEKFIYTDFVRDLRESDDVPYIKYPSEYDGQEVVKLCCTQHTDMDWETNTDRMTDTRQKEITEEWVDYLRGNQLPLREVQLCTLTTQKIFDALCTQTDIKSLRIKWLNCAEIKSIADLKHLKTLFIERAPSLTDISSLAALKALEVLIIGEAMKLSDYSPIGQIKSLKMLGICRYQAAYDSRKMKMQSDTFLAGLPDLSYLDLQDIIIEDRTFLSPETVSRLEFARFPLS